MSPQTQRRLRVAHIYQSSALMLAEPDAPQLHVFHTIRGLQEAGHLVKLIALHKDRFLCTEDLAVFRRTELSAHHFAHTGLSGDSVFRLFEGATRRIQKSLRLPYLAFFDSLRIYQGCRLNLKDFDLIHERFNLLSMGGAIASKRLGIPFVLEVNADLIEQRRYKGVPEFGIRSGIAARATKYCLNAASRVICVSEELRDYVVDRWGLADKRVRALPCAADVDAFGQQQDSEGVRSRLGLGCQPVVMWIGGFYAWHDLELLLKSFSQVRKHVADAKLVLVGKGDTLDATMRQARNRGLEEAVLFAGSVPHEQIPEILSIADVAVVPSVSLSASRGGTGTPLKIFEYMAAGKGIVATEAANLTGVIQSEYNGLLVKPGDVDQFSAAIVELLLNPDKCGELGRNARREACAKHSWEHYTKRLEDIYAECLPA